MSGNDVVVTGLGATTPLGGDVASTWDGLLAGRSGARKLDYEWVERLGIPVTFAATLAVEPTSILDAGRVLADLGRKAASDKTMRRTLARCADRGYRDTIAGLCFAHARASGDISLVLYDVTTLYFEAEHEDALRKVGYSKERRVDPQVVVGLLAAGTGSPWRSAATRGTRRRSTRSCR